MLMAFEPVLLQACFAILCVATLLSWGQLIFGDLPQMNGVTRPWLVSVSTSDKGDTNRMSALTQTALVLANLGITVLLVSRWIRSGHIPLSNLYESSMCLAWSVTCLNLILQGRLHLSQGEAHQMAASATLFQGKASHRLTHEREWLTAILSPGALLSYGFATLSLPKEMQQSSALVPALQSNWLMMHVSMMILSYGALLCGSLLAVTLLVVETRHSVLVTKHP